MEKQDSQTKAVVRLRTNDLIERLDALEFRRCVCRNPHLAQERSPVSRYLETVTINESRGCTLRNENVAVIDISDNISGLMDDREATNDICCDIHQELPVCRRKLANPRLWRIQLVNGLASGGRPSH